MDEDLKRTIRALGWLSAIGIAMGLSIAIGAMGGYYLDQKFGTSPWLSFIGLGMGIVAAFRNLLVLYRKAKQF
jgi:ATP synthase protein I